MTEQKPCPFCGSEDIYETYSQEWKYGSKNPEIFCNSCKVIFAIEDDRRMEQESRINGQT